MRNILLQKSCTKWGRETVLKKLYMRQEQAVSNLVSINFSNLRVGHNKDTVWNFSHLVQRYAQFRFLEKGMPIISPSNFVYDFQEKHFSCYILSTDQISLKDCLYFLRYWTNIGQYLYSNYLFPSLNVINFKINSSFLINQFFYSF